MGKKLLLPLFLLLVLLTACGGGEDDLPKETAPSPSAAPVAEVTAEPTPTPYDGPVSPLSGLPIGEEWLNRRPVAIMLNNLKEALPQMGQSQADIIYEVPAEGGITRMLAVYQSLDGVGKIGSIRSARPYTIWSLPWGMTPYSSMPAAARMPTPGSSSGGWPRWTQCEGPT